MPPPALPDIAALTGIAHRMADAARAETLPRFRTHDLATDNKIAGAFDPVTEADRASEAAIRAVLAVERPHDGIFGEEQENVAGTSGLTWVIDPIDGTRSFISGLPCWGTLIALDDGSRGVIGVLDQPYTDERFIGVLGDAPKAELIRQGTSRALKTRGCASLADATLFTTDLHLFPEHERTCFETVRERVRLTRYGVDCYAYALLASGHVDLVIESGLQPYDVAALIPLVTAAGGVLTDWKGGDPRWGGQCIAAGDPAIHAAALELLAPAAE